MARDSTNSFLLAVLIYFSNINKECRSDDLFLEGNFNSNTDLPGGINDLRHLPNLPFRTDTNRFSDGFSSNFATTETSPHFADYDDPVADISYRHLAYLNYMTNAALQGVGGYRVGDAVREKAREKIISQPGYQNLPNPTVNFTVHASKKWNPSGFAIQEGEIYNIKVNPISGSDQTWLDGGIRVNANGYESFYDAISNCYVGLGRCRSHLKKKRRLPTSKWLTLACAVGEYVWSIFDVQPGNEAEASWLPLDEARLQETLFPVGISLTFNATFSGELICFANDAHSEYWNNHGALIVTATRVSWPLTSSAFYKQQLVPTCDSALAVYANKGTFFDGLNHSVQCSPTEGGSGWDDYLN